MDSTGNLYIVDTGNYRIRKVSSGVITTVAGADPNTSGQFLNPLLPYGVAVGSDGRLHARRARAPCRWRDRSRQLCTARATVSTSSSGIPG